VKKSQELVRHDILSNKRIVLLEQQQYLLHQLIKHLTDHIAQAASTFGRSVFFVSWLISSH
jgi:hypothetical protein